MLGIKLFSCKFQSRARFLVIPDHFSDFWAVEHLIAISASFHFFVQCALTDRTESELRINAPCNELHASLDDAHTKKKTNRLVRFSLCWCGLRFANCAIAPACVRTQHFVLHLLAMSTVLDFRKCCALVYLFACGLPRLVASETSVIAKRGEFTRQSGVSVGRSPSCA